MLIWLKAGAWREGVSALFKAIRMELQSLQPQDSSTIKWNKTPSGMTAHVVDTPVGAGGAKRIAPTEEAVGSGGDTSYKGYFAVVDDSDLSGETPIYKVKVIDSASANEYSVCLVNNEPHQVVDAQVIITESCSIVLHFTSPIDEYSPGTFEIVAQTTVGTSNEGNIYYVLAEVVLDDGTMVITQRHRGNVVLYWIGGCEQ